MQTNQASKPVTILYVEDEIASRDIIFSMLEEHLDGVRILSADDGHDGLEQFRTHRPDIVITDIFMPHMNGIDMATAIKAEAPETIIIAITAYSESSYFMKAIEIGINHFVLKPLNYEKLLEKIGRSVASVRIAQKLKAQAERIMKLSRAVEQSPSAVVITDRTGRIEYVNPKFCDMTGYSFDEAQQMNVRILKSGLTDNAVYKDLWRTILSGGEWHGEFCNVKKNGEQYWESASVSPILDPQGNITHFVAVKENITERKKAEIEIRELNNALTERSRELEAANQDLEAFNYTVSHDLLAPVMVISGFADVLLRKYLQESDRSREFVEIIQKEAKRMDALIKALLKLSHLSSQQITRGYVDLSSLASVVALEIRMRYPERQVSCSIAPGLCCVGENDLLRIVLWNLLGNAWKYTAPRKLAEVEFGAATHEGETVYFVRDNGVGFDSSKADSLFKTFSRLHQDDFEGFGIGLATVQRIVDKHGGRVWAEGDIDKGACIYFTLPQPEAGTYGGNHGIQIAGCPA